VFAFVAKLPADEAFSPMPDPFQDTPHLILDV
jgi:hypothetical protein